MLIKDIQFISQLVYIRLLNFKGVFIILFNSRFTAVFAAISLLSINMATQTVQAATQQDNGTKVSAALVKDTIKTELINKQLEKQQIANIKETKLKEVKAEQEKVAQEEAAAQRAQEQKAAQEKATAQAQQSSQNQSSSQAPTTSVSGVNKGTFKLSFYDPSVLGSNMGYGGVAANLSVFPKGTQLKITLSDGTVWYRVVNDTGSFAASNPNQLDVAMPNSQVPSAGILYATVEVIG